MSLPQSKNRTTRRNHARAGRGICTKRKTPETVDRSISDDKLQSENPIITKFSRKFNKKLVGYGNFLVKEQNDHALRCQKQAIALQKPGRYSDQLNNLLTRL